MFYLDKTIYPLEWIDFVAKTEFPSIKTSKKIEYLNVSASFDIETTSFYSDIRTHTVAKLDINESEEDEYEKQSTMYGWVFGLNGKVILGRTWDDFIRTCAKLAERYRLSCDRRLIVYVHNLSFEFQFIKDLLSWGSFFALEERKPLAILAEDYGIEFRDSYALTGYSLEKVGEHLRKYKIDKMVGDLDYSRFRHCGTKLTYLEECYMRNDALVVMAHIQEEMERLGNITKIPLTKTGYVRNAVRNACLYGDNPNHKAKSALDAYYKYRRTMRSLIITSEKEYAQLKNAFQGGFTHCNALYNDETMKDITSKDFTSSYPYVMLSEKFPCQTGKLVTVKDNAEFEFYLNKYCCLFDATFTEIEETFVYDHYISSSKCRSLVNARYDNGRVVSATKLSMTLTEVDFEIIRKTYKWKKMTIRNMRIYMKNYLPHPFIKKLLYFYNAKTQLKDVEGKEAEYMWGKENLNSMYGMMVTDICRPDIKYDNEKKKWEEVGKDLSDQIKRYNKSSTRFLCYQWGIWVTAYARRNLWSGILELKEDHIYTDTDSLKCRNYGKHKEYFEMYNEGVEDKLRKAMAYHGFDYEQCEPKTIKGKTKLIGIWDDDGVYARFKTLGAKRYFVEYPDGKHSLTISGVNKKCAVPFLERKAKDESKDIFKLFTEGLFFDKTACGKKLHTYIDSPMIGRLTDYAGVTLAYSEWSGLHLESTTYEMSLAQSYIDFLKTIKGEIKDE